MLFSRRITCKSCGFKGVVEAHDTKHLPKEKIFVLLGKDREGYLHFLCPTCNADCAYGPTEFMNPLIKAALYLLFIAAVWIIIKWISGGS